ncbi:MAG: hypothetical protein JWN25_1024 [Verrucomicrobiales bacterium]|nr:hypothetical protein [Verrucomicrobiales bacterium]
MYVRKSLKDDDRQVISLESQEFELRSLAKKEGAAVYEVIPESRTAKIPGRPLFNEMLDRVEKGEANGILCWDIDRLYRNPIDEGRARWLLQRGVLTSILTPTRRYNPSDAGLLMAVEGGRAVEHVMSMAKALKRTFESKLRHGQWPGTKCFGFKFDNRMKNIVPDPETAPIIQGLFEEFAKGRLGLESGARWLAEKGILGKGGRPLANAAMSRLLTSVKFMGLMVWKGEVYEGKFPRIISIELFNKVQAVLKQKRRPRKVKLGHNFPFRGIFKCPCSAMYTAQWATGRLGGRYRYYRCTKKFGKCLEPYLREDLVAAQCFELLRPLAISSQEAQEIRLVIDEEAKEEDFSLTQSTGAINAALSVIDEKLRVLTRRLVDDIIDEDMYLASKEDLIRERLRLREEKDRLQKKRCSFWIEPTQTLISTLETLGKTETVHDLEKLSEIVKKVGTNPQISGKKVSFSFSKDYDFIPSLLGSVRVSQIEPSSSQGDQNLQLVEWCARRGSNPQPTASETVTLSN